MIKKNTVTQVAKHISVKDKKNVIAVDILDVRQTWNLKSNQHMLISSFSLSHSHRLTDPRRDRTQHRRGKLGTAVKKGKIYI